jgi:hypothetical protein
MNQSPQIKPTLIKVVDAILKAVENRHAETVADRHAGPYFGRPGGGVGRIGSMSGGPLRWVAFSYFLYPSYVGFHVEYTF